MHHWLDPANLHHLLDPLGPWAVPAFLLLQVVQVVVFWLPGAPVELTGGLLFGVAGGTVLNVVGEALGNLAAFHLARWVGRRRVAGWLAAHRHPWISRLLDNPRSVWIFGLVFLLPFGPKDVFCFAAGVSRVRAWTFLALSTSARIPGLLLTSWLGSLAVDGSAAVLTAALAGGLVAAGGLFLFRRSLLGLVLGPETR